ncbi:hypothetical protein Tco_0816909 [Tanacetum coccineum]
MRRYRGRIFGRIRGRICVRYRSGYRSRDRGIGYRAVRIAVGSLIVILIGNRDRIVIAIRDRYRYRGRDRYRYRESRSSCDRVSEFNARSGYRYRICDRYRGPVSLSVSVIVSDRYRYRYRDRNVIGIAIRIVIQYANWYPYRSANRYRIMISRLVSLSYLGDRISIVISDRYRIEARSLSSIAIDYLIAFAIVIVIESRYHVSRIVSVSRSGYHVIGISVIRGSVISDRFAVIVITVDIASNGIAAIVIVDLLSFSLSLSESLSYPLSESIGILHRIFNRISDRKDYKDKKKQKRSKTNKKREKDKESRARVRNQPEITAGSARHSNKKSQRSKE